MTGRTIDDDAPCRLRLQRSAGSRLPAGAVKVDRSSPWGNPFVVGGPWHERSARAWAWSLDARLPPPDSNAEAVQRFAERLVGDSAAQDRVRAHLRGRDLACWCRLDEPCHADVLLRVANQAHP